MASEVILRELNLLHKKKPLIVSMGDYAASGGYYISCQADSIFALPTTITGSIGVFSMMFDLDKMLKNKLGVTFDEVKNAPYADIPTAFRAMTPAECLRMQGYVDTIYGLFKGRVATGRRIAPADVDSIAQGRVWTGTDAIQIHLVDGIGGLNRAITSAAQMSKLTDYRVVMYPESEDKLTRIFKKLKKNNAADEAVKAALKSKVGMVGDWIDQVQGLAKMNGKAMMAMPFVPKVQ
jgi:protease-4